MSFAPTEVEYLEDVIADCELEEKMHQRKKFWFNCARYGIMIPAVLLNATAAVLNALPATIPAETVRIITVSVLSANVAIAGMKKILNLDGRIAHHAHRAEAFEKLQEKIKSNLAHPSMDFRQLASERLHIIEEDRGTILHSIIQSQSTAPRLERLMENQQDIETARQIARA